ncbi:MAG: ZIP family metal transporter [Firmicutes bacterium]|nr:ZIP family metal transporter [Bacillota bacterium]
MYELLMNTLIGVLVGVLGTGLGGILSLTLIKPNKKFLSFLLGSTAGIMLSIVTFDLLPEAQHIGGIFTEIVGIILGIILVIFIEDLLPKEHFKACSTKEKSMLKAGILMGIGIAIHNLPEGLAVGSGFMLTSEMGMKVAFVIALHNIPEGIAMATPLRLSGYSKPKVLILTLLCGLPTGIGAFFGAFLGSISNFFIALCLSFAAGTMLYITCGELIPSAKRIHNGKSSTLGVIFGFILGILIVSKL